MNGIITTIQNLVEVIKSWALNVGKLFFSDDPEEVTMKMLDENTNEPVDKPVKNLAMIKQEFEAWKNGIEKRIGYTLTQTGFTKNTIPITDFSLDSTGLDPNEIDPTVKLDAFRFSEEGNALTVAQGETATFGVKLLAMFCRQSVTDGLYDISFGGEAIVVCDGGGNVTVVQNKLEAGRIAILVETDAETGAHVLKPYLWPGFANGSPDIDAYIPRYSTGTVQVVSRFTEVL